MLGARGLACRLLLILVLGCLWFEMVVWRSLIAELFAVVFKVDFECVVFWIAVVFTV